MPQELQTMTESTVRGHKRLIRVGCPFNVSNMVSYSGSYYTSFFASTLCLPTNHNIWTLPFRTHKFYYYRIPRLRSIQVLQMLDL